jgi:hypothetical protein
MESALKFAEMFLRMPRLILERDIAWSLWPWTTKQGLYFFDRHGRWERRSGLGNFRPCIASSRKYPLWVNNRPEGRLLSALRLKPDGSSSDQDIMPAANPTAVNTLAFLSRYTC